MYNARKAAFLFTVTIQSMVGFTENMIEYAIELDSVELDEDRLLSSSE